MPSTLAEHIALRQEDDHYVSSSLPQQMGNAAPIAYGGYTIALAIRAAYLRAPDGFHVYSVLGHYLRAAHTESSLILNPVELRRSRSFATYRVVVQQKDKKTDEQRLCAEVMVDFHCNEPSLLQHSATPTRKYSHWTDCQTTEQRLEEHLAKPSKTSQAENKIFSTLFGLSRMLWDARLCPEGVATQNLVGIAKSAKTSQDDQHATSKSSADWIKVKHPLKSEAEQMGSLAFILDGLLSFLPLVHNHLFLNDSEACSSLDFALRVFVPRPNLTEWHLREAINHEAGQGRTYSESRLWDESGNMVASMTQQSILRAPRGNL
ncbi:hypothetical protein CRV24_006274 [Beauveria bassiana]|uniref:Acyl-CoA thioesterase II n=1 Tax=Beauveria bassiana (strain ARSEF 2860) TaxID=655819 RepID=J4UJ59_BEAB2|nr:acyl-CoA thioesterase II [Beauveria bassiana ARSEF 2860]EJP63762.1 acyl-CoA thioesterase II [Beauveria bassiana ARSEF 2860]KAF1734729.1 hypothetical protein CRV24_006274 [Beauveria bassiana]KAH8708723.1 hypothetical protein HC256_008663 [Beauveria bassiana]